MALQPDAPASLRAAANDDASGASPWTCSAVQGGSVGSDMRATVATPSDNDGRGPCNPRATCSHEVGMSDSHERDHRPGSGVGG
ncbi:hypothetical protein GCM10009662_39540 [Catellatospora coxensis]|uniref:Uncharacterized protein n=1 Tax=Catellatospora coxensis TaxID=310354 RepID=A0A8J3P7G8_9ACTN|nr:hypothetical protein Cco03nite_32870 [Catellatospora coxensis]